MKYLKSYKIFEFKETESNTPLLYKSDNLEVKVVKTFDACKNIGKDTMWCSNAKVGFYKHNMTANMYRFIFKDGYKLRLTWDYIDQSASENSYSGGTHWGSGGEVKGESIGYYYIRPEDESEPFLFDYNKGDHRKEMVDRINSIPQKVIDLVHNYQEKSTKEKTAILNNLYKEVQKIEIVDLNKYDGDGIYDTIITIKYRNKKYELLIYEHWIKYPNEFIKDFKNKYAFYDDYKTIDKYIIDKSKEILKNQQ